MNAIAQYLKEVQADLARGNATEHTYRPALKKLVESFGEGIAATNEPKREKCGAPDFIVTGGEVPLGYVEAKDIGTNLNEAQRSEQLRRYLGGLNNLILTDYLEFRWYEAGKLLLTARLTRVDPKGRLQKERDGEERFSELLREFLTTRIPTISGPKELAARMAGLAKLIHDIILQAFKDEDEGGTLHTQMEGFKKVLLHDLEAKDFADMYAQTISYGLFAARCNHHAPEPFTRKLATYDIPQTNPFLQEMFDYIAGRRLDKRLTWAVDHLAELLNRADIAGILTNFGKRTRREDPVVHFYETFLAAYDPKMREARGVYYTPEPVVSYIVRSVDYILKKDFGLKDGLADTTMIPLYKTVHDKNGKTRRKKVGECHKVLILDPACGTGTFLHGVIDHIHEHIVNKGQAGTWSSYVSKHLLPRLFGFELLMAPYAVAHMKLGLQLAETGYDFKSGERLRIYLTNTLEEAHEFAGLDLFATKIAEEANAASEVKSESPVMVILGNPPYSGHSQNKGEWICNLVEDYRTLGGKKIRLGQAKWLQNDYIKFIRFAQHRIAKTGYGIVGMVTDHSYIDSGTFVGMRANLKSAFDHTYVLDLHGNSKRNRNRPDPDQNVFDITQGVAIMIGVRRGEGTRGGQVLCSEMRGLRNHKYSRLNADSVDTTRWEADVCHPPYYLFVSSESSHLGEYGALPSVAEILPGSYKSDRAKRIGTGFVTTHDSFAIAFTRAEMEEKVNTFLRTHSEEEARAIFRLCGQDQWNYAKAHRALLARPWKSRIRRVLYRPLDWRYTVWDPNVCVHRRLVVHGHLSDRNLILCVGQAGNVIGSDRWELVFVSAFPVDFNLFYRGGCAALPLYLYQDPRTGDLFASRRLCNGGDARDANLAGPFLRTIADQLRLSPVSQDSGDLKNTIGATDILRYIYAVLYSPIYRTRYAEFLKIDFPRVPLSSSRPLFRQLCELGEELVGLHLMEKHATTQTRYEVSGENRVEKVRFSEPGQGAPSGRVWINKTQYFDNVPPDVWEFHIGGYQVCQKWLKDRKGRTLTYDDLTHYQHVVSALRETMRVMADIDKTIEKHGGWPIK